MICTKPDITQVVEMLTILRNTLKWSFGILLRGPWDTLTESHMLYYISKDQISLYVKGNIDSDFARDFHKSLLQIMCSHLQEEQ